MKSKQVLALAAVSVASAWLGTHYHRQKHEAVTRLQARSRIVETARGPVEYAITGEGPTLLFVHGILGGYDQSLLLARLIHGFTVIAPSRPGYLRTPLATGRTAAEQADVYAALLDALNIPKVAIIGGSGGGPSAIRFALQHPDRCWALVMVSAICLRPSAATLQHYWLWAAIMPSDFTMWVLNGLTFDALLARTGITPAVRARIERDSDTTDIVRRLVQIYPTSNRRIGLVNDLTQTEIAFPLDGLGSLSLPTLVIHGASDPIVPFENGEHVARTVPGAALLAVEGGGHLCIATHRETTIPTLEAFLHRYAPLAA